MKDHLRRKHKMYKDMYKSLLGSGSGPLQVQQPAPPKWRPENNEVEGLSVLRPETVLHEGHHQGDGPLSVLRPETVLHEGHHSLMTVGDTSNDPNNTTSDADAAAAANNPNSVQVKNEQANPDDQ